MIIDYYEILGIDFSATPSEIKLGFKKKAKLWHPDITQSDTKEKMQQILEAYNILFNEKSRKIYDEEYLKYKNQENKTESSDKPNVVFEEIVIKAKEKSIIDSNKSLNELFELSSVAYNAAIEEIAFIYKNSKWYYTILLIIVLLSVIISKYK